MPSSNKTLCGLQQECMKLALEKGFTFDEFALVTGCKTDRLKNLYYGKSNIPLSASELSEIIQLTMAQQEEVQAALWGALTDKSLPEIVQWWMEQLNISELKPSLAMTILAEVLGVSTITVRRWLNNPGAPKPHLSNLRSYHISIVLTLKRLNRSVDVLLPYIEQNASSSPKSVRKIKKKE